MEKDKNVMMTLFKKVDKVECFLTIAIKLRKQFHYFLEKKEKQQLRCTISYYIRPYYNITCRTTLHLTISHCTLHHIISYHGTLYHITLYTTSHHTTLHYAIIRHFHLTEQHGNQMGVCVNRFLHSPRLIPPRPVGWPVP